MSSCFVRAMTSVNCSVSSVAAFSICLRTFPSAEPTNVSPSSSACALRSLRSASNSSKSRERFSRIYSGVASMNLAKRYASGRKWNGARRGGTRLDGQVLDRGSAKVDICWRSISRMRKMEPGFGASPSDVEDDGDVDASSNHLTHLSCLSLIVSKQIGHCECSETLR